MIDVAIVLGHFYGPHGFSSRQIKRLQKGVELYHQGKVKFIMTTGGVGWFNKTEIPLAILMRNFLLEQGIPDSKIITEAKSKNTIEDARYSLELVNKFNFKSAVVVSSFDHLLRARRIFKRVFPSNFHLEFAVSDYFSGFWSLMDLLISPVAWFIYFWHRLFRSL